MTLRVWKSDDEACLYQSSAVFVAVPFWDSGAVELAQHCTACVTHPGHSIRKFIGDIGPRRNATMHGEIGPGDATC